MKKSFIIYEDSFFGALAIDEMVSGLALSIDQPYSGVSYSTSVPIDSEKMIDVMLAGVIVCIRHIGKDEVKRKLIEYLYQMK